METNRTHLPLERSAPREWLVRPLRCRLRRRGTVKTVPYKVGAICTVSAPREWLARCVWRGPDAPLFRRYAPYEGASPYGGYIEAHLTP
ncbi:MAG: hypothetical protein IJW62_04735 [Clostridia bacterium]|nr:hypothetical protein [Clostridia bacterium]